jgi:hypothetical protein
MVVKCSLAGRKRKQNLVGKPLASDRMEDQVEMEEKC